MANSMITKSLEAKRDLIENWIHRWGCSTSEAILDLKCNIFQVTDIEGFIGYRIDSSCVVIYGDPVCAPENTARLTEAFHQYCHEEKLNIIYIIVSENFANWAINDDLCAVMIGVGEELIFDPKNDPAAGHKGRKLRYKVNHAQHLGLRVHEYLSHDRKIENSIQQLSEIWQNARKGPQIYLGDLNFFENRSDRRWFYVQNKERIIGAAMVSKLKARQGWLLKFLIAMPKAPHGTSELLMSSILDTLRKENCHFLTYGMVPSKKLGKVVGLNKISEWFARGIFKMAKWIFNLDNRKLYWRKFQPKTAPSYILFEKAGLGWQEIRAVMKALKIELK